jgi:predicted nicotinamide N-methyase
MTDTAIVAQAEACIDQRASPGAGEVAREESVSASASTDPCPRKEEAPLPIELLQSRDNGSMVRIAWALHVADPAVASAALRATCVAAEHPDLAIELGALGVHTLLAKAASGSHPFRSASSEWPEEALAEQATEALATLASSSPPGVPFPAVATPGLPSAIKNLAAFALLQQDVPPCCSSSSVAASVLRSPTIRAVLALGPPVRGKRTDTSRVCPFCLQATSAWGELLRRETEMAHSMQAEGSAPPPPIRFDVKGSDTVLLSPIRMRMTSHQDVGAVLWPAAPVLARWVMRHEEVVKGKTVLEIAAGLGLVGLVAARFARSVTITDFHVPVLSQLKVNLRVNVQKPASHQVAWLDWDTLAPSATAEAVPPSGFENAADNAYDVILGSDILISKADCEGVARVCHKCLKEDGLAVFLLVPPSSRYGTEHFAPALGAAGLSVTTEEVESECIDSSDDATTTAGGYQKRMIMYSVRKQIN